MGPHTRDNKGLLRKNVLGASKVFVTLGRGERTSTLIGKIFWSDTLLLSAWTHGYQKYFLHVYNVYMYPSTQHWNGLNKMAFAPKFAA